MERRYAAFSSSSNNVHVQPLFRFHKVCVFVCGLVVYRLVFNCYVLSGGLFGV